MLWITGEIFYYLGLILAALFVPALAAILSIMSLVDRADPSYWLLFVAWTFSALMFLAGVAIKRWMPGRE